MTWKRGTYEEVCLSCGQIYEPKWSDATRPDLYCDSWCEDFDVWEYDHEWHRVDLPPLTDADLEGWPETEVRL